MKKQDDRITNTSNLILSGAEVRTMRKKDLERWKRRAARQIEAQRYNYNPETTSMEEQGWMSRYNEALDMALKIINAKDWKNI